MDCGDFFAGTGYAEDAPVIEADDTTYDYRSMLTATHRIARLVSDAGEVAAGADQRVALSVESTPLFLATLLGIAMAGRTPVVLNPLASTDSADRLVAKSGASLVVTTRPWSGAVPAVSVSREVFDSPAPLASVAHPGARLPGVVMFSSGTTGEPKVIWLPESTLSRTLERHQSIDDYEDDFGRAASRQTISIVKPLFHMSGMWNSLRAIACCSRIAMMSKFDAATFAAMVERFSIRQASLTTSMLVMLLDQPTSIDAQLGTLTSVRMGAMALDPGVRAEFHRRFGCVVLDSYGQTETCGEIAGWTPPLLTELGGDPAHATAVGRPNPGLSLTIRAADGTAVNEGEICLDLAGWDQRVDGVLVSDRTTDGLHHTGDIGRLDDAGLLHVTGRLGRQLNCGGFKVSPEEIERALLLDDAVKEAVVVGVPDRRLGTVPVAAVVVHHPDDASVAALAGRVRAQLDGVKAPRRIVAIDRIPVAAMGKADYAAVNAFMTRPADSPLETLAQWSREPAGMAEPTA